MVNGWYVIISPFLLKNWKCLQKTRPQNQKKKLPSYSYFKFIKNKDLGKIYTVYDYYEKKGGRG